MENQTSKMIKEMVQVAGFEIGISSDDCTLHKTTHKNCKNCKYELACGKYSAIMMVHMQGVMYESKNFDDYTATYKKVAEKMKQILEAKTHDEIKNIL